MDPPTRCPLKASISIWMDELISAMDSFLVMTSYVLYNPHLLATHLAVHLDKFAYPTHWYWIVIRILSAKLHMIYVCLYTNTGIFLGHHYGLRALWSKEIMRLVASICLPSHGWAKCSKEEWFSVQSVSLCVCNQWAYADNCAGVFDWHLILDYFSGLSLVAIPMVLLIVYMFCCFFVRY